jgi:hypothetical protein
MTDHMEALLPGVETLPPRVGELDIRDRGGLTAVQAGEINLHGGLEQLLYRVPVLCVDGVEDGIHEFHDLRVFVHEPDCRL